MAQGRKSNEGAVEKPADRGLAVKLAEVMGAVQRVEKKGRNAHFKYDYVKEEDLVEAVRGELFSRNVILMSSAVGCTREDKLTTVHMQYTFRDADSGQEYVADWFGTGDDPSDKGLYKAYTGALKHFLTKTFLIPTGDDPERDKPSDKQTDLPGVETIDGELVAKLKDHIQAVMPPEGDLRDEFSRDMKLKLGSMGVAKNGSVNAALPTLTPAQAGDLDKWLAERAA